MYLVIEKNLSNFKLFNQTLVISRSVCHIVNFKIKKVVAMSDIH